MTPIQRLNALDLTLDLSSIGGRAQIHHWNYLPHLPNNLPHRHTFFEVCSVGGHGAGEFRVANTAHPIATKDTFFARPGVIHQIVNTTSPDMELYWVCFSLEGRSDLVRAFTRSDLLVTNNEAIIAQWEALFRVSSASFAGHRDALNSLVEALLISLLGVGSGLSSQHAAPAPDFRAQQTQVAVRFIHDNLSRPLSTTEIAAHIHVSPRQLARLFAQYIGTSPANYIEVSRLDRAEALLLRSSLSLKAVAREVGYEDSAHFSRVFSRRNGNPPGDFRKRGGPLTVRSSGANIQRLGELV